AAPGHSTSASPAWLGSPAFLQSKAAAVCARNALFTLESNDVDIDHIEPEEPVGAGGEVPRIAPLLANRDAGVEAAFEGGEQLDRLLMLGSDDDVIVDLVEGVQHQADQVWIEHGFPVRNRGTRSNRMRGAARQPRHDLFERRASLEE